MLNCGNILRNGPKRAKNTHAGKTLKSNMHKKARGEFFAHSRLGLSKKYINAGKDAEVKYA